MIKYSYHLDYKQREKSRPMAQYKVRDVIGLPDRPAATGSSITVCNLKTKPFWLSS
jgi:hypothetical protein